jgi:transcriptional regulator with XRE-family HTH domain
LNMPNQLSKEIIKLRRAKKLTQNQVADKLNLPRTTYAKKEIEGDFTLEEIPDLHKIIGGNKDVLGDLVRQNDQLRIDDWKEYLIKNAIYSNAMNRVLLSALGEVLAKQRGESVTKVLGELKQAVEVEKSMNSVR